MNHPEVTSDPGGKKLSNKSELCLTALRKVILIKMLRLSTKVIV